MRIRTHVLTCIGLAAFGTLLLPLATHAQINLEVGIGSVDTLNAPYLANYLVEVYQFVVSTIGIIAAVMIMFNGMRWVTAAGNSENIKVAKDGISSAIVGLLIALLSYVLLNAINPSLVGFPDLEQTELSFIPPETTSDAALASGEIADDASLVHYMDVLPKELLPYLDNAAPEPYITKEAYTRLEAALKIISHPDNYNYYGMQLRIAGAHRSLDKQRIFYACYKNHGSKGPCPEGCQNPGPSACNVAAQPGYSNHGYGTALDSSWVQGPGGKYVTNKSYATSDFQDRCLSGDKINQEIDGCPTEAKESIVAFNTMMQAAGFDHICIEWWHEQVATPGSTDEICDPGVYKSKTKK